MPHPRNPIVIKKTTLISMSFLLSTVPEVVTYKGTNFTEETGLSPMPSERPASLSRRRRAEGRRHRDKTRNRPLNCVIFGSNPLEHHHHLLVILEASSGDCGHNEILCRESVRRIHHGHAPML